MRILNEFKKSTVSYKKDRKEYYSFGGRNSHHLPIRSSLFVSPHTKKVNKELTVYHRRVERNFGHS
jgi:hypothetical protein